MLRSYLICPLRTTKIFVEMSKIKARIGEHLVDLLA